MLKVNDKVIFINYSKPYLSKKTFSLETVTKVNKKTFRISSEDIEVCRMLFCIEEHQGCYESQEYRRTWNCCVYSFTKEKWDELVKKESERCELEKEQQSKREQERKEREERKKKDITVTKQAFDNRTLDYIKRGLDKRFNWREFTG
jgi:hypothetical protein